MLCAEPDWPHYSGQIENAINEERRQMNGVLRAEGLRGRFFNVIKANSLLWQRSGGERAVPKLLPRMSEFRRGVDDPSCPLAAAAHP